MLISQLLGEFNMGFSSLTGDTPLAGSETLNSLAIQTLSSAMARRGGLRNWPNAGSPAGAEFEINDG